MNVQAFNKELAKKVAAANRHEKNNKLEDAIKVWLAVTEMALGASKSPRIPSEYRTMLIKKTEQIISRIKKLKVKLAIPRPNLVEQSPSEIPAIKTEDEEGRKDPQVIEVVDDSNLKKIPEGFLEIQAPKDFEIITPHEKIDPAIFKDARKTVRLDDNDIYEQVSTKDQIILEQPKDGKTVICFACGAENPVGSKSCESCNTEFDS